MGNKALSAYLKGRDPETIDAGFLAYVASLEKVGEVSPQTAASIVQELADQRSNLKLIASENYSSLSTQLAMGNLLTDKYAEGFAYHRFMQDATMWMPSKATLSKKQKTFRSRTCLCPTTQWRRRQLNRLLGYTDNKDSGTDSRRYGRDQSCTSFPGRLG